MVEFSTSDVAKVMNHANVTSNWLPTDSEARDVMRSAIETGVLLGAVAFYVTDEGDYIAVIEAGDYKCVTTKPVSTRYMWRSGLRGGAAVKDMLIKVQNEITAARTGVYP